eukprot:999803-Prorocentrum_minimum.AAC.2
MGGAPPRPRAPGTPSTELAPVLQAEEGGARRGPGGSPRGRGRSNTASRTLGTPPSATRAPAVIPPIQSARYPTRYPRKPNRSISLTPLVAPVITRGSKGVYKGGTYLDELALACRRRQRPVVLLAA